MSQQEPKYALAIWAKSHSLSPLDIQDRQETALRLAIEGIADGSIDTLDSVESPLSMRIKSRHGVSVFEMNSNWIETAQQWKCPCCERGKFEISRVGNKGQILAKLVVHHDHMSDVLKAAFNKVFIESGTDKSTNTGLALVERMAPAFSAYSPVLICEDCNNADAAAKKIIVNEGERNKWYSFSISQIRHFIHIHEHAAHTVDKSKVLKLWEKIRPAYAVRMKLVYEVAKAAALQDCWYERYPAGMTAVPTLTKGYQRYNGLELVSVGALVKELSKGGVKHVSNYSRWRTEKQPMRNEPPLNYLAIIKSQPGSARAWESVNESWVCPICERAKREVVSYMNGKVRFSTHAPTWSSKAWRSIGPICNDCFKVVVAMKRELHESYGTRVRFTFDCITPDELRSIIHARPYSPPLVTAELARRLVEAAALSREEREQFE